MGLEEGREGGNGSEKDDAKPTEIPPPASEGGGSEPIADLRAEKRQEGKRAV